MKYFINLSKEQVWDFRAGYVLTIMAILVFLALFSFNMNDRLSELLCGVQIGISIVASGFFVKFIFSSNKVKD